MAYIQILAIVLCACILQDAYAQKPATKKSPSKRSTAVAKSVNSESLKLNTRHKHPNLTKVQTKFWQAWDYINNKNQYGKMGTRSARNMFKHMVNNKSLWGALVKAFSRYSKITHNKINANEHVKLSNILGELMTSPIAKKRNKPMFTIAANYLYESLVQIQSKPCEATLVNAINIVKSGLVGEFLDKSLQFVNEANLRPLEMGIYAHRLHKLLDLGGMMKMGKILSNGVLKLADVVTKEEPKKPKAKSKQVNNQKKQKRK